MNEFKQQRDQANNGQSKQTTFLYDGGSSTNYYFYPHDMQFTYPSTVIIANAYVYNSCNQTPPKNVRLFVCFRCNLLAQNHPDQYYVNLQNVTKVIIDQNGFPGWEPYANNAAICQKYGGSLIQFGQNVCDSFMQFFGLINVECVTQLCQNVNLLQQLHQQTQQQVQQFQQFFDAVDLNQQLNKLQQLNLDEQLKQYAIFGVIRSQLSKICSNVNELEQFLQQQQTEAVLQQSKTEQELKLRLTLQLLFQKQFSFSQMVQICIGVKQNEFEQFLNNIMLNKSEQQQKEIFLTLSILKLIEIQVDINLIKCVQKVDCNILKSIYLNQVKDVSAFINQGENLIENLITKIILLLNKNQLDQQFVRQLLQPNQQLQTTMKQIQTNIQSEPQQKLLLTLVCTSNLLLNGLSQTDLKNLQENNTCYLQQIARLKPELLKSVLGYSAIFCLLMNGQSLQIALNIVDCNVQRIIQLVQTIQVSEEAQQLILKLNLHYQITNNLNQQESGEIFQNIFNLNFVEAAKIIFGSNCTDQQKQQMILSCSAIIQIQTQVPTALIKQIIFNELQCNQITQQIAQNQSEKQKQLSLLTSFVIYLMNNDCSLQIVKQLLANEITFSQLVSQISQMQNNNSELQNQLIKTGCGTICLVNNCSSSIVKQVLLNELQINQIVQNIFEMQQLNEKQKQLIITAFSCIFLVNNGCYVQLTKQIVNSEISVGEAIKQIIQIQNVDENKKQQLISASCVIYSLFNNCQSQLIKQVLLNELQLNQIVQNVFEMQQLNEKQKQFSIGAFSMMFLVNNGCSLQIAKQIVNSEISIGESIKQIIQIQNVDEKKKQQLISASCVIYSLFNNCQSQLTKQVLLNELQINQVIQQIDQQQLNEKQKQQIMLASSCTFLLSNNVPQKLINQIMNYEISVGESIKQIIQIQKVDESKKKQLVQFGAINLINLIYSTKINNQFLLLKQVVIDLISPHKIIQNVSGLQVSDKQKQEQALYFLILAFCTLKYNSQTINQLIQNEITIFDFIPIIEQLQDENSKKKAIYCVCSILMLNSNVDCLSLNNIFNTNQVSDCVSQIKKIKQSDKIKEQNVLNSVIVQALNANSDSSLLQDILLKKINAEDTFLMIQQNNSNEQQKLLQINSLLAIQLILMQCPIGELALICQYDNQYNNQFRKSISFANGQKNNSENDNQILLCCALEHLFYQQLKYNEIVFTFDKNNSIIKKLNMLQKSQARNKDDLCGLFVVIQTYLLEIGFGDNIGSLWGLDAPTVQQSGNFLKVLMFFIHETLDLKKFEAEQRVSIKYELIWAACVYVLDLSCTSLDLMLQLFQQSSSDQKLLLLQKNNQGSDNVKFAWFTCYVILLLLQNLEYEEFFTCFQKSESAKVLLQKIQMFKGDQTIIDCCIHALCIIELEWNELDYQKYLKFQNTQTQFKEKQKIYKQIKSTDVRIIVCALTEAHTLQLEQQMRQQNAQMVMKLIEVVKEAHDTKNLNGACSKVIIFSQNDLTNKLLLILLKSYLSLETVTWQDLMLFIPQIQTDKQIQKTLLFNFSCFLSCEQEKWNDILTQILNAQQELMDNDTSKQFISYVMKQKLCHYQELYTFIKQCQQPDNTIQDLTMFFFKDLLQANQQQIIDDIQKKQCTFDSLIIQINTLKISMEQIIELECLLYNILIPIVNKTSLLQFTISFKCDSNINDMLMKTHFKDLIQKNEQWQVVEKQILLFTEKEKITEKMKRRSMIQLHTYIIENSLETWQNVEFVTTQLNENLIAKKSKEELFIDIFSYLLRNMKKLQIELTNQIILPLAQPTINIQNAQGSKDYIVYHFYAVLFNKFQETVVEEITTKKIAVEKLLKNISLKFVKAELLKDLFAVVSELLVCKCHVQVVKIISFTLSESKIDQQAEETIVQKLLMQAINDNNIYINENISKQKKNQIVDKVSKFLINEDKVQQMQSIIDIEKTPTQQYILLDVSLQLLTLTTKIAQDEIEQILQQMQIDEQQIEQLKLSVSFIYEYSNTMKYTVVQAVGKIFEEEHEGIQQKALLLCQAFNKGREEVFSAMLTSDVPLDHKCKMVSENAFVLSDMQQFSIVLKSKKEESEIIQLLAQIKFDVQNRLQLVQLLLESRLSEQSVEVVLTNVFKLSFSEQFQIISQLNGVKDEVRLALIKRLETFLNCQQLFSQNELKNEFVKVNEELKELKKVNDELKGIKDELKGLKQMMEKMEKK